MQVKKYSIPSARLRTQMKRNVLSTLEKPNDTDATWLNDVHPESPIARTQTQEHTVCYEDLPTMPLSILNPSLAIQAPIVMHDEELIDEDKTIRFNKRKKADLINPLDALLYDDTISAITVLGPHRIYIERDGVMLQTPLRFSDEQHMLQIIERLLLSAGQALPAQNILTDVRLPDGSLLTVVLPPSVLNGPALTLRKNTKNTSTLNALVRQGLLNSTMANALHGYVQAHLNIVICGPIGSGRTTLLNALCAAIPSNERIVTIEDVPELRLSQPQVIALQANTTPDMTVSELVARAEHMRVRRVIVGECRNNEAVTLLQAMYNGLHGVMTTMYAQNVKDCLTRFETLCLLGSTTQSSLSSKLVQIQIAQSINLVISLSQQHKITHIAKVRLAEEGVLRVQNLFH